MKYKIKLITGFRKDQAYSIDADEAHKAYYLFFNPEKRAIFKDGLALRGEDIKVIEPDYNGTMEWTPTYQLGDDDWVELNQKGVPRKLRNIMAFAKEVAQNNPEKITTPLSDIAQQIPERILETKLLTEHMKI